MSDNNDDRKPLPPNTIITDRHGVRYMIKAGKVVGGGSALIYRVEREDTRRNLILKECYPRSRTSNRFFREGVVVRAANEEAQREFALVKENMRRECTIGQLLSAVTSRVIGAWYNFVAAEIVIDGKTFNAAENFFVVMEQADNDANIRGWFLSDLLEECARPAQIDAPFRNGGLPSAFVSTCVIELLLKALRDINEAGCLHGDINDANIFFAGCDAASGDLGLGQLIDFGNTLELDFEGKTAPIDKIFSTNSFGAPEIFERTESVTLTRAADIFSVGCLMLYLLKGFSFRDVYGREQLNDFPVDTFVTADELICRGYRPKAAELFRKILRKALRHEPAQRYQSAQDMLKDILALKNLIQPPKFTLPTNLTRSPYFVDCSRDNELCELQRALDFGDRPLWIYGVGGQGKTELAMEFARMQIENGRAAHLVTFDGSIKQTVLNLDFSGWQKFDDANKEYRARLDVLKENYDDTLLIIDNFDSKTMTLAELQKEPAYAEILALNLHVLFTTRSRPNESVPELEPISESDCLQLFAKIIGKTFSPDEEEIIRKIIREVERHTMTVELLARTLKKSWGILTAKELLKLLRQGRLDAEELPEIMHAKNFTEREAKIYGHLRTLFKIAYSDEYREILCDLTLIPPDGFDAADFLLSVDKKKLLKHLETAGWCRRRAEDNLLFVHPLIKTVLKTELRPTNDDCAKFLDNLWARRDLDEDYPPDEDFIKRLGKIFVFASESLGDPDGTHKFRSGHCNLLINNCGVAHIYLKLSLETRQKIFPKLDLRLADTYLETGLANLLQRWLIDLEAARSCILKAIEIYEQTTAEDAKLAEAYAALALACEQAGDFDAAIDLSEKVLAIFEREPPKNEFKLARVHGNFGRFLMKAERYAESLEHLQTAATILERLTPRGHLNVVSAYRALTELHKTAGNLEQAFHFAEKTIQLAEDLTPKNPGEIGRSYGFLGKLYGIKARQTSNLAYFRKSDELFQLSQQLMNTAMLPKHLSILDHAKDNDDNNTIVHRYRGAADSCRVLERYPDAEKYILAALKEIIPDQTDPTEIFLTHFSASQVYADMKIFDRALDYAHRAKDVYRAVFPDDEENFLPTIALNIRNIHARINLENSRLTD